MKIFLVIIFSLILALHQVEGKPVSLTSYKPKESVNDSDTKESVFIFSLSQVVSFKENNCVTILNLSEKNLPTNICLNHRYFVGFV